MSQVLPRYCPRCGAPIVTSSGSCVTCGLSLEDVLSREKRNPPGQGSQNTEPLPGPDHEATQHDLDLQPVEQLDKVPTVQLGQQSHSESGTQLLTKTSEQTLSHLSPQNKTRLGRRELLVLLLILLLILGAIIYAFAGFLGLAVPGFVVTQPSITTTVINTSVPYAGVDITIVNVQQSQSFLNDPNTSSNGMVRLNLEEHNQTDIKVVWSYAAIARLVLPDKSLVSPTYVNSVVRVAPGAAQKSVVDFAVPANIPVHKLLFVLGATHEAQMLIPLVRNVNVGNYQAKSIHLDGQMLYFGLNWTLTSATSSFSVPGQQAAKGMRYLTLTLKVDNTLSQIAITGSAYEYMRLRYGALYAIPEHTTVPVAFNAGAIGITGTVSFQVPQQASSFTLILAPQKGDSGDQDSADFHLP